MRLALLEVLNVAALVAFASLELAERRCLQRTTRATLCRHWRMRTSISSQYMSPTMASATGVNTKPQNVVTDHTHSATAACAPAIGERSEGEG